MLNRRLLARIGLASVVGLGLAGWTTSAGVPTDTELVTRLADEYIAGLKDSFPEYGTFFGLAGARHDRLSDNSLEALEAWRDQEDRLLTELRTVDAAELVGTQEFATHGFLLEALESSVAMRVCREELWAVNQTGGWQVSYPAFARAQPVGTPEARAAALARWSQMDRFVDAEIVNLRRGLALGYTAARVNVDRVIGQLEGMLAEGWQNSPYLNPAKRDGDPEFVAAMEAIVRDEINPAIERYLEFLKNEYRDRARSVGAVSANPSGSDCYQAALRKFTTLDITPTEVHQLGLEQVARLNQALDSVAQLHFDGDRRNAFSQAQQDPRYRFSTGEEMITFAEEVIARASAVMPQYFGRLAKAPLVVEPFPEFQQASAPGGQYLPSLADGSRPGRYLLNTSNPSQRNGVSLESLSFHEAVPGHHWQLALAQERPAAHDVTKVVIASAFAEGWALYSEMLADEAGLYSSEVARMAMLGSQMFRAARLVVDTGIHHLGWSRQQALEYMTNTVGPGLAGEIDRYIGLPGQATSYMIGRLELDRLRAMAQEQLGADFDIREFHDMVLSDGTVTLPMLQTKVAHWLATR